MYVGGLFVFEMCRCELIKSGGVKARRKVQLSTTSGLLETTSFVDFWTYVSVGVDKYFVISTCMLCIGKEREKKKSKTGIS